MPDKLKLLVVDDEPGIVDFIMKIYSRKGFAVFGATDGIQAVDIYKKEQPDIAVIDVHMPYSPIDGIEVLERIRQINPAADCIMVTRITEKDQIEQAKTNGAVAYLLKPMELEDLDKVISEICAKKGQKENG